MQTPQQSNQGPQEDEASHGSADGAGCEQKGTKRVHETGMQALARNRRTNAKADGFGFRKKRTDLERFDLTSVKSLDGECRDRLGCGSAAGGRRKRRGRRAEAPAARSPPTGSPNEKGPAHGDGALSRNPSSPPGDGLEKEKWRSKKPRRPWRRVRVHGA